MTAFCEVILGILAVGLVLSLIRLGRGPSLSDRIVALDLMATITVAAAGVYSIEYDQAVFLDVAPARLHIAAEKFNFAYLGDRRDLRRMQNYRSLVQDCLGNTTAAVLNRGAQRMSENPDITFQYPSKHAFEEETIWLLWRHFGSGRDLG